MPIGEERQRPSWLAPQGQVSASDRRPAQVPCYGVCYLSGCRLPTNLSLTSANAEVPAANSYSAKHRNILPCVAHSSAKAAVPTRGPVGPLSPGPWLVPPKAGKDTDPDPAKGGNCGKPLTQVDKLTWGL